MLETHRNPQIDVTSALRASDILTQITTLVGALEELAPKGVKRRAAYLSYRVARLRYPRFLRGKVAAAVFSPHVDTFVSATKLAASMVLPLVDPKSPLARALRIAQTGAHVYAHTRVGGYGQDGSDHALSILHAAQLVASFSERGSRAERAAFDFIAAQGLLSYLASGLVKAVSPVWRAGAAMQGITRATSYGDQGLNRFMREYPGIAKAVAWATILGETAAPLVLISPPVVRVAWQSGMIAMHAGIARYMGLNRFFWAFTAFHPVIAPAARQASRAFWHRGHAGRLARTR